MDSPYNLKLVEDCVHCELRNESFFCSLPPDALKAFEGLKFSTAYPRGAVLFVEGQKPRGIYMLCTGKVKLSVNSAEGKTLIVGIAEPGDLLGLNAVVSGDGYEIAAETTQPSQVNFVKREDFVKFLQEYGSACLQTAQHLSKSCNHAYDLVRTLALSQSASEKLAKYFIDLTSSTSKSADGFRIQIGMTHEEIAQVIGTSRETVTRLLSDFRQKKLATLKGSTLLVHNRTGLEKLVQSGSGSS